MSDTDIIERTRAFIEKRFSGEGTGHDYWHMYRVWKTAQHIAKTENDVDQLMLELAALLHDVADWKFHEDEEEGPRVARAWLESINVDNTVIEHVEDIIRNVSFKGAHVESKLTTIEGKIVHDADKLDALGAIGVARAFAYGGSKQRSMYEPSIKPKLHDSFEAYKNDKGHTINHFYEKLLLLKERMFTDTGKALATHRHKYMEQFLDEFYKEWEGDL